MKIIDKHEYKAIRHLSNHSSKDAVRRAFRLSRDHMEDVLSSSSYKTYKKKRESVGETNSLYRDDRNTIFEGMVAMLNSQMAILKQEKQILQKIKHLNDDVKLLNIR
ncbi:MAG: hypothetical protein D6822_02850 [Cyanobacteria bacterium J149]|nr:MAG: hypothetical protein D6822_02850 [Cyanobacteria bacterium J149]